MAIQRLDFGTAADDDGEVIKTAFPKLDANDADLDARITALQASISGTNTGDQNTFTTIAVAGQSNVVADSTSDTLTLVAGANVTLTTNAATDTITISAAGAGGGAAVADGDYGDVVVSGSGTVWAIDSAVLTTFGRSLVDDIDAAAARTTLGVRELLTNTRTYYVRTDGNNSNTGLVNNAGGAFLTIQKAIDVAALLDTGASQGINILVANGTYAEAVVIRSPAGGGGLTITGNTVTPGNVVVNSFSYASVSPVAVKLEGFSLGVGSYPLLISGSARIELGNMLWTGTSWTQIAGQDKAAIRIIGTQTYTSAACPTGIYLIGQASADIYSTLNHAVVTAYSNSFVYVASGARLGVEAATFTGTATGPRHFNQAGIISLGGKTLPGNAAGTDVNGGQTF